MIEFTLISASVIIIPFTLFVVISFWKYPRAWIHSFPKEIQEFAGKKTHRENTQTKIFLILYIIILPGLSTLSLTMFNRIFEVSVIQSIAHIYSVWILVHFWDFLVDSIHIIIFKKITAPPIKGSEELKSWYNYSFHFKAFLKAIIFSSFFTIPLGIIVALF